MFRSLFTTSRKLAALGLAAGAFALAGCGEADPNRVATFPVQGAVTFDGKPIPGAMVVLHPKSGDARVLPARGHVGPNGDFLLTTYEGNDGAAEGDYTVTVTLYETIKQGESYQPGPNVLPRKYESAATSDLQVHVAQGENQLPALTLKR